VCCFHRSGTAATAQELAKYELLTSSYYFGNNPHAMASTLMS
jgi:hypothetical protein